MGKVKDWWNTFQEDRGGSGEEKGLYCPRVWWESREIRLQGLREGSVRRQRAITSCATASGRSCNRTAARGPGPSPPSSFIYSPSNPPTPATATPRPRVLLADSAQVNSYLSPRHGNAGISNTRRLRG